MQDYIELKRVWQDAYLFEMEVTCASEHIVASNKVYTTNQSIDNLAEEITRIVDGEETECLWENGEKGDAYAAYISMKMMHKDKRGHIQIEVYMELQDGGSFAEHHCCFYVNTEIGMLMEFGKNLQKIKQPILGRKIRLN
nr:hypothetical protein [Maliibacterium massiliense]